MNTTDIPNSQESRSTAAAASATGDFAPDQLQPDAARSEATPDEAADAPIRGRGARLLAALACGGLALGAASMGRSASGRSPWYRTLRKSKATPPSQVFGPVWTGLYSAIAYSGYRVWRQPSSPERTRALRLWGLQMALNASWTPLFFGAHRPKASAAVATALVPTVAGYMVTARKVDKPAAWLMLPYLAWSSFAAYLNAQIVYKNNWRI